ncbi:hypothetical protein J6590_034308 [Homalodisca vitripennis]|nr:hypothetical protein J6590_034308 [Homalodisca vitripennis]
MFWMLTNHMTINCNKIPKWALNSACLLIKSRPKSGFSFKNTTEACKVKNIPLQALENKVQSGKLADKVITAQVKDYSLRLKHLRKETTSNYIQNSENKQNSV